MMDVPISLNNSLLACRCCMDELGEINEMIYIFESTNIINEFSKCTSIEPKKDDGLPSYICSSCHTQLRQFHEFFQMCLTSENKFRTMLKIKTEQETNFIYKDDKIEDASNKITRKTNYCSNTEMVKEEFSGNDSIKESGEDEDIDDEDRDEDYVEDEENIDNIITRQQTRRINDKRHKTKKLKIKREFAPNEKGSKAVFPCTLCNRKFFRERRLEGHIRQHQGLKPAVCKLCGKEFAKWGGLDTHIMYAHNNVEKQFICDEPNCGKSYMMKQSLVTHKKRTHSTNPEKKTTCNYICEQCGKSFSSSGTLKKHTFIHSGQMPFKCLLCPRKYVTKHKLKEHMMRHDGIKNFVCPVCGLRKTTMHELKVHINYHTREKLYPCKLCSAVFTSIGNRGRHVKIVHCGIKAYQCTYCDRSFGKAETLKHHTMTHTGEKPHCCNVCGKRFIQSVALQTHMKTHTKIS